MKGARERILDVALRLFYKNGFQAVGIDTIIAEAGVAKMSLYNHFASKDDLIVAYLEESDRQNRLWLEESVADVDDPEKKLVGMFEAIAQLATSPECQGCTFQTTAAEFPSREHPGHRVALAHKQAMCDRFTELAEEAGLVNPEQVGAQLLLLMDGAWAAARMFGPENHADTLTDAAQAVLDAHKS